MFASVSIRGANQLIELPYLAPAVNRQLGGISPFALLLVRCCCLLLCCCRSLLCCCWLALGSCVCCCCRCCLLVVGLFLFGLIFKDLILNIFKVRDFSNYSPNLMVVIAFLILSLSSDLLQNHTVSWFFYFSYFLYLNEKENSTF